MDLVSADEEVPVSDGEEDPVSGGEVAAPPLVVDERFNQLDEVASESCSPSILLNCGPVVTSSSGESICSQIVNSSSSNNGSVNNVGNGNVNFYGSVVAPDDAPAGPGSSSQDSEMSQASGPRKRPIVTGTKNKIKAKKTFASQLPGSIASSKKISSGHLVGSIASAARFQFLSPKSEFPSILLWLFSFLS